MKRRTVLIGLAGTACAASSRASETGFPSRPLRLIVPFAPGGGADFLGRAIAEGLAKQLGQPVIVENKAGGGGALGAAVVTSSKADGYTLLYGTPGAQMINPHLMKSLPYDPDALASVAPLGRFTNALAVHPSLPVKNVAELIAYAKAKPGELNFCSAGIGSSSHLAGELFKYLAKIDIRHVPYRGTGVALQDLLGGTVQMAFDSIAVYLPHFKAGTLRPLGVTDEIPSDMLPGVPPIGKTLPGFRASPEVYLATREGVPAPVIERLNSASNAVVNSRELKDKLADVGIALAGGTPAQLDAIIAFESTKWRQVIDASGARAQ